MNVGKSVMKAIDEAEEGDFEAAMMYACNAIDGTAAKTFPSLSKRNNLRFTSLLRDNYLTLSVMGMPGTNLVDTRFPVHVDKPKATGGAPDLADVIYGIHRCVHGHGDELPDGFEFRSNSFGPGGITTIGIQRGRIQLSDRVIFAMLAVAVFAPENVGQITSPDYALTLGIDHTFVINEWWGRRAEFETIATGFDLPSVTMNFGAWMT